MKKRICLILVILFFITIQNIFIVTIAAHGQIESISNGESYYIVDLNDWNNIAYGKISSSTPILAVGPNYNPNYTKWKFIYDSAKSAYKIVLESLSTQYLSIKIDTCSSYPQVITYTADSTNNNRYWTITRNSSDNTFTISPKLYSDMALVRSGNSLTIRNKNTSLMKKWRLYKYNDKIAVTAIIDANDSQISTYGYTNSRKYWSSMNYSIVDNYKNGSNYSLDDISIRIEKPEYSIMILEGHGSQNGLYMYVGEYDYQNSEARGYIVEGVNHKYVFKYIFRNNKLKN